MMKYQRGLSLSGLIYWGIALGIVGLFAAKVVPSYVEFRKAVSAVKRTVADVPQSASVPEIRKIYSKHAEIDNLDLRGEDLDITKEGGNIVINFSYDKKIHLFGPMNVLMEYKGSSK